MTRVDRGGFGYCLAKAGMAQRAPLWPRYSERIHSGSCLLGFRVKGFGFRVSSFEFSVHSLLG